MIFLNNYTLFKFLCWFDHTFLAAIAASIRWINIIPTVQTFAQLQFKCSSLQMFTVPNVRNLKSLWLQLIQYQKLVNLSENVLTFHVSFQQQCCCAPSIGLSIHAA